MTYSEALSKWTPEQWQQFGSLGGRFDDKDNLVLGELVDKSNLPTTYGGLTAGDWMSAGGLGLQAYNTFFGPQKGLAEKQIQGIDANIKLANQQIKSNKQAMADRKEFNTTWANASNGLVPRTV